MKNKNKQYLLNTIKLSIILLLSSIAIIGGLLGVSIVSVLENTPDVNVDQINDILEQTSEIVDSEGNKIENIQTSMYRELISYDEVPENLINAFIALEDKRFYNHNGVDFRGIISASFDNLTSSSRRGASTIAQQLARNLYLSSERKIDRKIQEAYLALKLTENLGREGVMEKYLNTVFLGQNSYGVQAASKAYFFKDVSELTLAESVAIASIVKNPAEYALYKTVLPENVTDSDIVLGDIEINEVNYRVIYNDAYQDRQKHGLLTMLDEKLITDEEYNNALSQNIAESIIPGENSTKQIISSYYIDLISKQVIEKLQSELNYSKEEAVYKYYNGGITVFAAIDIKMQNEIQEVFKNFSSVVLRNYGSSSRPAMLDWSSDYNGNITNSLGKIVYYKKSNLINDEGNLFILNDDYELNEDGSLSLTTDKFIIYGNFIDPKDYYTINEQNNLVTHIISTSGAISSEKDEIIKEGNRIIIKKSLLDRYPDLYTVDDSGTLVFNKEYLYMDYKGTPQPQGSIVVIDHSTGLIKAIVGGRNQEGRKILNRASDVPRQPGSTIKPIAVYTPALDNGYTAATPIDDTPLLHNGEIWPKNVYGYFKGLVSLRESVRDSINVNAVKTLQDISINRSKIYLEKFGIIDAKNPENDNFISVSEDPKINDENPASMALGGMTYGLTNLELTAAYAAIANGGEYIEPLTFTKVIDNNGNILLEDANIRNKVVSPQVAYLITDIMKDVLTVPFGNIAYNPEYDIAGKTGTTQENQDIWFVGFSPYYTIGSWVGFDNQQLKLSTNGGQAVTLWKATNNIALQGKEKTRFIEPEGIIHMKACTIGDGKPTSACYADYRGVVKTEIFVKGTEPTTYCKVHVFGSRGLFLNRPIPFDPSITGIYPKDWNIFPIINPKPEKIEKEDNNNDNNVNLEIPPENNEEVEEDN